MILFAKSTNPIFHEGIENLHNQIMKLGLKIKYLKEITKYIYKNRGFLFIININDFLKRLARER